MLGAHFVRMFELIATIILIVSLAGIAVILYRKVPVLVELPEVVEKPPGENIFLVIKKKIKGVFPKQIVLHKILSWIKILTLKIETKIDKLLNIVRKKAQKEKEEKDNGQIAVQTTPIQEKPEEKEEDNPPAGGLPPTTPE